jgi:hypothetical protein
MHSIIGVPFSLNETPTCGGCAELKYFVSLKFIGASTPGNAYNFFLNALINGAAWFRKF